MALEYLASIGILKAENEDIEYVLCSRTMEYHLFDTYPLTLYMSGSSLTLEKRRVHA